jgi:acetaldehyde dehydrogenase / alcohol dehydrogenase
MNSAKNTLISLIPEATMASPEPAQAAPASEGARNAEELAELLKRVKAAQLQYATFTQEKVDAIFRAAALAANAARIPLARMAVTETRMGVVEDKVVKNHFASEFIYNKYRETKTCGVVETDAADGITKIVEPVGVIAAVVPTTNPTSTAIFKSLLALKTRNAVVFAPHPRAKACTCQAAKLVRDAAVAAGAPADIIGWIAEPTVELTNTLIRSREVSLILATGGPGMVKAAYASGNPAIGVGAGNTPAVIDETADVVTAVSSIILSKTFDNGVICASEQSIVVVDSRYDEVKAELAARGALIVTGKDRAKLAALILKDGKLNADIVGQSAARIAEMAGIALPRGKGPVKVLIGEAQEVSAAEPFAYEKLSPVLGLYRAADFAAAVDTACALIQFGGLGHTSVLYTDPQNADRIRLFSGRTRTGRVLVNMPSSQGAIGDIYNFRLEPSLTLGCGSWGGNSVSENVGVKHLLNVKTVAERRENMLWFRVPPKVYHKYGCLSLALRELAGRKRAFIVTDKPLFDMGYVDRITKVLDEVGVDWEVFSEVEPDPTLATVRAATQRAARFKPDTIIALGGGSPMDAAKILWVMYEHPEARFEDLALRFMDIRKRIYQFPAMGQKAMLVAVPTTSGTGSEVTPFAVVTDERTGIKYPIADYALTPNVAIVDPELTMRMPKGLTAAGGIDAVSHSLEAMVSVLSTEYTNAMALESLRILFKYLPDAYEKGEKDPKARAKVHNAASMAGMAFANAFLGVCHSMAHKLGAEFKIPHGIANALLLSHVILYNATDVPVKQAAFSQYTHPDAKARYARVADYLGLGGDTPEEKVNRLVGKLEELKKTLGIPGSIRAYGIPEDAFRAKVEELSAMAFDDQCTGANPRFPLMEEINRLYLDAYEGKLAKL